ncbi:MAG: transposase domain-containing protein, partial [Cloacibacillus porcorum]|uniref:transposase domain-containing protein n=1 Tax=Cloacibacillus porcorum TaxID=1197717 RepID=UPI0023F1B381
MGLEHSLAERSIKQFVIGRKNWLFSSSPKGAEISAVIYSIIERAKENHFKPYEYLKYILENMPNTTPERYHTILPWSKELLCCCKLKGQPDSMAGDNDESCDHAS